MNYSCGTDEVGRGAGIAELYAGACILDPQYEIEELIDSKALTPQKRERIADEIKKSAICWCIATASVEEIEKLNIHNATLLAMKRAIQGLSVVPDKVYVDGNHAPAVNMTVETVVKGDTKIPSISAASILAKVARDQAMIKYHEEYPEYRFDKNKGYFTKQHLEAIRKFGPCQIHRKNYKPVREALLTN